MKSCVVVATAFVVFAFCPSRAHAQSRVSVEIGGIVSAYDVASSPGVGRAGLHTTSSATPQPSSDVVSGGAASSQGIAAFEVRPTVTLQNGFLMGVGFRVGQAGLGDVNSSLVGADIGLGFQHRFGHFMPFIKGVFGVNSYDLVGSVTAHQTDLRLDAVVGSRLYLSRRMYVAAAAFAGFGDRYGGTLSVGGDVVQVFRRGAMP
jgi:hypothetical protein